MRVVIIYILSLLVSLQHATLIEIHRTWFDFNSKVIFTHLSITIFPNLFIVTFLDPDRGMLRHQRPAFGNVDLILQSKTVAEKS